MLLYYMWLCEWGYEISTATGSYKFLWFASFFRWMWTDWSVSENKMNIRVYGNKNKKLVSQSSNLIDHDEVFSFTHFNIFYVNLSPLSAFVCLLTFVMNGNCQFYVLNLTAGFIRINFRSPFRSISLYIWFTHKIWHRKEIFFLNANQKLIFGEGNEKLIENNPGNHDSIHGKLSDNKFWLKIFQFHHTWNTHLT